MDPALAKRRLRMGLGFTFWDQGLGFKVKGLRLGSWVQGVRFEVEGIGFRVQGFRLRV